MLDISPPDISKGAGLGANEAATLGFIVLVLCCVL